MRDASGFCRTLSNVPFGAVVPVKTNLKLFKRWLIAILRGSGDSIDDVLLVNDDVGEVVAFLSGEVDYF